MKTIALQLRYLVLIAAFFTLYPFDNVHAFTDQDRSFIYEERKDTLVQLVKKNYRGRRKGFIFGLSVGIGQTSFTEPFAEYYWRNAQETDWLTTRQTRGCLGNRDKNRSRVQRPIPTLLHEPHFMAPTPAFHKGTPWLPMVQQGQDSCTFHSGGEGSTSSVTSGFQRS